MDPTAADTLAAAVAFFAKVASAAGAPAAVVLGLIALAFVLSLRVKREPPPAPDAPGNAPDFPNPMPQQGPDEGEEMKP